MRATTRMPLSMPEIFAEQDAMFVGRAISITILAAFLGALPSATVADDPFRRGDANSDGRVNIVDPVFILYHIFQGGAGPRCPDTEDVNDDGTIDLSDATRLLGWVTCIGTPPPSVPGPFECGEDPSPDGLDPCVYTPNCMEDPPHVARHPDLILTIEGPPLSSDPDELWASVILTNLGGDGLSIGSWSLRLRTSCAIDELTDDGTIAAPVPEGLREPGGIHSAFSIGGDSIDADGERGIVSTTVLTLTGMSAILPGSHCVLRFRVLPPDGSCEECEVLFDDVLDGDCEETVNILSTSDGLAYRAVEIGATISFCRPAEFVLIDGERIERRVDLGQPVTTAAFRTQEFPIDAPARVVVLELDPLDRNAEHAPALFARWGGPASSSNHDVSDDFPAPSRRIVLPRLRSGTLHVTAEGALLPKEDGAIAVLSARLLPQGIASLSIDGAGARQVVGGVVRGGGFDVTTRLRLRQDGGAREIFALITRLVSPELAELSIDLRGAVPGTYDLELLSDGIVIDVLDRAFTVREKALGPHFDATLDIRRHIRFGRWRRATLALSNRGDAPVGAPLIRLEGPPGTEWRLPEEESVHAESIVVLAAAPSGGGGVLAPGESTEIPLFFRASAIGEGIFRASLFVPPWRDEIDWRIEPPPAGVTVEAWSSALPGIAVEFGDRWRTFAGTLGRTAGRLATRGQATFSVDRLFRFATRRALGRFDAAVCGVVTDDAGTPLADVDVAALREGTVRSTARTTNNGAFAVDWLEPGAEYELRIVDHELTSGPSSVIVPRSGDILGLRLTATALPNGLLPDCPDCGESGLPERSPLPGPETFELAAETPVEIIAGRDPNEKDGSPGERTPDGRLGFIAPETTVEYTVFFENAPSASAAEQVVRIADVLDPRLEITSLRFKEIVFGEHVLCLDSPYCGSEHSSPCEPTVIASYSAARASGLFEIAGHEVVVEASAHIEAPSASAGTRIVWLYQTLDPLTCGEPLDDRAGFLPPNDASGIGEGYATFIVTFAGDPELPDDEEDDLANDARITFDLQGAIVTQRVFYDVGTPTLPEIPHHPRPVTESSLAAPIESLAWQGGGANSFAIRLWMDGSERPTRPTANGLIRNGFRPREPFAPGTHYFWQVTASNAVGETLGPIWSFETYEALRFVRGDVEQNGSINITDPIATLGYLFLGGEEPVCLDAADADDSGGIDITDAILVLSWLVDRDTVIPHPAPSVPTYSLTDCDVDPSDVELPYDGLDCRAFEGCR
jgi:hypothetical protein